MTTPTNWIATLALVFDEKVVCPLKLAKMKVLYQVLIKPWLDMPLVVHSLWCKIWGGFSPPSPLIIYTLDVAGKRNSSGVIWVVWLWT